jgi:hypothetical protein
MGHEVTWLVGTLCYYAVVTEIFYFTKFFHPHYGPGVDSQTLIEMSTRKTFWGLKGPL